MKKPINEIKKMQLMAGLINEIEYNNSLHTVNEIFSLSPKDESDLENIIAKYVKDPNDISKEMDAYYSKGYQGFSDMLQANLNRDNEFRTWVQRTHDAEQFSKETNTPINEDWGSSDQATFNSSIHKDLGEPETMPMPFDKDFEAAVESAVDFYWDEWDEYKTDRDGLIDHAKRTYYRSYFPEQYKGFVEMFSERLNEAKETKELTLDNVNPYEYRHGLQHELGKDGEYTDEALEKAKTTVLKNLAKDVNFYSTLLNQKQSPYEFKATETDAPGMQANADGTLKKGAGKLEKANVKDNLGKKEEGKTKPKGVKELPDKGVEGKEKIVKEGKEEVNEEFKYFDNYEEFENTLFQLYPQVKADPEKYKKERNGEVSYSDGYVNWASWNPNRPNSPSGLPPGAVNMDNKLSYSDLIYPPGSRMDEDNMESNPVNGNSSAEGQFNDLMKNYDWYYEMSDDNRKYDNGISVDQKLKALAKTIGADKAVDLFNAKAPSDRKVTTSFFMEGKEDKHAKLKELLKAGLKKEIINPKDIQAAKTTGDVVNIPVQDTAAQTAAKNAKINFRTYK